MTIAIINMHHHRAKPRAIANEHMVDIQLITLPRDAVRTPALGVVVPDAAAVCPALVATLEEAAALEIDDAGAVGVDCATTAGLVADPEATALCGEEAAAAAAPPDPEEVPESVVIGGADDRVGEGVAEETEAAMVVVEDDGEPMMRFLIVNFPDAFPLSPKRTRI